MTQTKWEIGLRKMSNRSESQKKTVYLVGSFEHIFLGKELFRGRGRVKGMLGHQSMAMSGGFSTLRPDEAKEETELPGTVIAGTMEDTSSSPHPCHRNCYHRRMVWN